MTNQTISRTLVQQAMLLAGTEHKYQKLIIILFSILGIQTMFFSVGPSYLYMNPIFNCQNPQNSILTESEICDMLNHCKLVDKFTLTYEINLYCDRSWIRTSTQTFFSVGSLLGLVLISLISDLKGRKPALFIALAFINAGGIFAFIGGVFQSSFLLILSQLCGGFSAFSLIPLTYTIFSDFCSFQFHQKGVAALNFAGGLSIAILGFTYVYQIHWSTYLLFFVIIPVLIISALIIILFIQSPHVLMHSNNQKQALKCLKQICQFNELQKNIPLIYQLFQDQNKNKIKEFRQNSLVNLMQIVREKDNLKPIVILMIIYCFAMLHFYGVHYSLQRKGLGFGVNNIIIGLVDMTAIAYLNFVIHRTPRKYGMIILYLTVAVLGLLFLIPSINSHQLASSIVIGLISVSSTVAYPLLACMQTQSFKVQIQSTAAGFIQIFGIIGSLLAPLIVDFTQNHHLDPISFNSILIIFAIIPGFFLKQTLIQKTQVSQNQDQNLNEQFQQIEYTKQTKLI